MGSCSSKPKTAEFEPASDAELEKPALLKFVPKAADNETSDKVASERSLQTLLVENGHCDLLDALLQSEKVPVVGISLEQKQKNDMPSCDTQEKADEKKAVGDGGKECPSELLKERIVKSNYTCTAEEKIIVMNEVSVSLKDKPESQAESDANIENTRLGVNYSSVNATQHRIEFKCTENDLKHMKEANIPPEVTKETVHSKENEKIIDLVMHTEASDKLQNSGGSISSKFISNKELSHQTNAANDIDDMLEKLASEFERQESLSSSRS